MSLSQTTRPSDNQQKEKKEKKKENLADYGLYRPGRTQGKFKRKRYERLISTPC